MKNVLQCECIVDGRDVLIEMVKDVSTYHILHDGYMKEIVTEDFISNILSMVSQFKDDYKGIELIKRVFSVYCAYIE